MSFSEIEKKGLLSIPGVGPTVLKRLEQIGFSSFSELKDANPDDVVLEASLLVGGTCWRNSPQARRAVNAAINFARSNC